VTRLEALLTGYKDVIELERIGFPGDWEAILIKKIKQVYRNNTKKDKRESHISQFFISKKDYDPFLEMSK
jgi:hypothetical protein